MIKIRIKELAKERGIKNAHRLQLAADLSPAAASRFWKCEIEKISMETLGRLCKALECQPGDLFVFVPDETNKKRNSRAGLAAPQANRSARSRATGNSPSAEPRRSGKRK